MGFTTTMDARLAWFTGDARTVLANARCAEQVARDLAR
jgi:hypothetical protein